MLTAQRDIMTTYIVTFEVNDTTRKNNLAAKLAEYGTYCSIHENCWAVVTSQTAVEVRSALDEALDASDRIFVIRSGTEAAWRNTYDDEHSKWLKDRL